MTDGDILEVKRALVRVGDGKQVIDVEHGHSHSVKKPLSSTVVLPVAPGKKAGSDTGCMSLPRILQRIDRRLKALDLSSTAASSLAGLSNDAIRNMRRRVAAGDVNAGISTRTLEALASVLKTTVHWLQTGEGSETLGSAGPVIDITMVPLMAWSAGPQQRTIRTIGVMGMPKGSDVVALRVPDNDMNLVAPADSIIFVDRSDRQLQAHCFYLVTTEDGMFFRQFERERWVAASSHRVAPLLEPVTVVGRVLKSELIL